MLWITVRTTIADVKPGPLSQINLTAHAIFVHTLSFDLECSFTNSISLYRCDYRRAVMGLRPFIAESTLDLTAAHEYT
jgi:hypothetical protein